MDESAIYSLMDKPNSRAEGKGRWSDRGRCDVGGWKLDPKSYRHTYERDFGGRNPSKGLKRRVTLELVAKYVEEFAIL